MRKTLFAFSASILAWLLSVALVVAQANCSELVTQALEAVSENCGVTGRNEACYGYDQVEASFLVDVEDSFFSQPASISAVADLETIRTAPLDTETGVWGVAVMNLQADLPNTLPGQSVTVILLGDVEVENAVAAEDAFQPSDGLEVIVSNAAGANVRSGPGTNFNVVGGLQDGATVLADGLSEDGAWLRVAYRDRPAWLSLTVIAENPALSGLPTLSAALTTPMQAIYLRTGIGQSECSDVPDDLLLVQGPENIEISLTVNGANIQLGSSGALRVIMIDGQPFLEIIVFDGDFQVGGQTIRQGQHSVLCLGDADSRGLDGEDNDLIVTCDASVPEAFEDFGEEWCGIENLPGDILNYSLEVLCPGETSPPVPTIANTEQGDATNSELGAVDCSSFAIQTSTIPAGAFTLTWSAATGADSYEVAVFDGSGYQTSVYGGLTGTSIALNGGAGFASGGYVDVRAYQGGQYACYVRLNFTRAPDPNEPEGGYSPFDADWSCTSNGGIQVTWDNAAPGESISLESNAFSGTIGSGSDGSFTFFSCNQVSGATVSTSVGTSVFLGSINCGCD